MSGQQCPECDGIEFYSREVSAKGGYGPDVDHFQSIKPYSARSEDSDQTDHKYILEVYQAGKYVELAHYASVKQIVIQNDSAFQGVAFYTDNTTGALVPDYVDAGEHISINNPNVVTGLMLYAELADEATEWHLVIIGRLV